MKVRKYADLRLLPTFEERYAYLRLAGEVGAETFGFDRWVNQHFYKSYEWKKAREVVILRDEGCDLGIPGHEIYSGLMVHHMNPMTPDHLSRGEQWVLDPEYLICVTLRTHNAIHYGDESQLPRGPVERRSGDTKLW